MLGQQDEVGQSQIAGRRPPFLFGSTVCKAYVEFDVKRTHVPCKAYAEFDVTKFLNFFKMMQLEL